MKLVFGAVIRDGESSGADSVLDALEAAGIEDDAYEWLVWSRNGSLYIAFLAPLAARAAVLSIETARLQPIGELARSMQDNRNSWIEPRSGDRAALLRAEETLAGWQSQLWAVAKVEETREELVDDRPAPDLATRHSRRARKNSLTEAKEDILAAFGLSGAKDSDGNAFSLGKLDDASS